MGQYLSFNLEDQRFALALETVEKVIHSVEITPIFSNSPDNTVLGVINYHGTRIPIMNLRDKFKIHPRETELTDRIIIVNNSKNQIGILANQINGIFKKSEGELFQDHGITTFKDGTLILKTIDLEPLP